MPTNKTGFPISMKPSIVRNNQVSTIKTEMDIVATIKFLEERAATSPKDQAKACQIHLIISVKPQTRLIAIITSNSLCIQNRGQAVVTAVLGAATGIESHRCFITRITTYNRSSMRTSWAALTAFQEEAPLLIRSRLFSTVLKTVRLSN